MEKHNATISVVTWFLLVVSTFSIAARFLVKSLIAKSFNLDDHFAIVSLVFNGGAGIAISFAAQYGLGRDSYTIDASELVRLEKSAYAFEVFYIMTLCFAKLSIVALLGILFSGQRQTRVWRVLGVIVLASSVAFVFTVLFQCRLPNAWGFLALEDSCINLVGFWRAVGFINIVTDLGLVVLPYVFIRKLQMSKKRKAIVLACFGCRLFDVVACIVQLCYTSGFRKANRTAAVWPWFIIGQVIQTVTIISSSAPYLRQALDIFPSGMFQSDELRRRGLDYSGFSQNSDWTDTSKSPMPTIPRKWNVPNKDSPGSRRKVSRKAEENLELSAGFTQAWGDKAEDDEVTTALRLPSDEMAIVVQTTVETSLESRHDSPQDL